MATMQEVATRAGVALSTVSYVVNGTKTISPATRERVLAAIEELGFQPNALARGLASKRTRTIALLFPVQERDFGFTEAEFITAAIAVSRERGYHLMVWPAALEPSELGALVGQGIVDGVLMMEVHLDDPRIAVVRASGIPLVLIGRPADPIDVPFVDIDFERTVTEAVGFLSGLGHRNIGFVSHSEISRQAGYGPTIRAELTFAALMADRGVEPIIANSPDEPGGGRHIAQRWHQEHPELTAIITMNDRATFGLVGAFADLGVRVPDDMSVLAIASSARMAELIRPAVSTFEAPAEVISELGMDMLITAMTGPVTGGELVSCQLVERTTTGPAPTSR